MNQVYARIKRKKVQPYRRVVSGQRLFDITTPSLGSRVAYAPTVNLDEDSWFQIENFRSVDFFPTDLNTDLISADVVELQKDEFTEMSYLVAVQGDGHYFQRIRPTMLLRRKVLAFGDVAAIEDSNNRLVIDQMPDAIFLPRDDVLLFKSLADISAIFRGADQLYKEATAEEVTEFLGLSFINASLDASRVSIPNRKRIALALDTLSKLSEKEQGGMISYIQEYCDGRIEYDPKSGKFNVGTDDELKNLVYGIEQRFYTTPIGEERRLANSVIKI